MDAGEAAKIVDTLDLKNIRRWILEEDASSSGGLRSGKAFAVAGALTKKGFAIDRAAELAIAAALADADAGESEAQCRAFDVVMGHIPRPFAGGGRPHSLRGGKECGNRNGGRRRSAGGHT